VLFVLAVTFMSAIACAAASALADVEKAQRERAATADNFLRR
jgi:hypothetical protein